MTSSLKLATAKLEVVAISVSAFAILLLISGLVVVRKFWRERKKKKQVNVLFLSKTGQLIVDHNYRLLRGCECFNR